MDVHEYEKRIAALERENRILRQKLYRNEINRAMLEEMLETHSRALKVRNEELEVSRELIEKSEAMYRDLAHRDALTRLPNRVFFLECLVQGLARAKCSNTCIALLFLDLDQFKPVNDNLGHDAGDIVLSQTAERLLSCVRNKGTVARIGGDEFAILLEDLHDHTTAKRIGDKIISTLSKPFLVAGEACQIGTSIGISLYPFLLCQIYQHIGQFHYR